MLTHPGCGSGGGERWLDSECILKIEPTGFSNTLHVAWERKRGIKGDFKAITQATGRMELPPVEMGRLLVKQTWG